MASQRHHPSVEKGEDPDWLASRCVRDPRWMRSGPRRRRYRLSDHLRRSVERLIQRRRDQVRSNESSENQILP
jgi:hypothetical protein